MSPVRIFASTLRFNLKNLTLSAFFVLISVFQPLIFASIAFYMWKAGARPGTLLYVALGAGLMGMWSATLFGSGGAIQFNRWQGTLEVLVAAPASFLVVMVGMTMATASIGLYSIAATLFWGRVFFGVPLDFVHPVQFAIALPVAVVGLGMLGLVMASTFVLYRNANAFANLLEYPIWLITGLLVPVALLPGWVEPISWVLAPTWGVEAIRNAALGGDTLEPIAMCLLLSVVYLAVGSLTLRNFERMARRNATLSLT